LDGKCDECKQESFYDVENINPIYNPETYTRDFENLWWACRKCHMEDDGRIKNLELGRTRKKSLK